MRVHWPLSAVTLLSIFVRDVLSYDVMPKQKICENEKSENACEKILKDDYRGNPFSMCVQPSSYKSCCSFCFSRLTCASGNKDKDDIIDMNVNYFYLTVNCTNMISYDQCQQVRNTKFSYDTRAMCKDKKFGDLCCTYCKEGMKSEWDKLMIDEKFKDHFGVFGDWTGLIDKNGGIDVNKVNPLGEINIKGIDSLGGVNIKDINPLGGVNMRDINPLGDINIKDINPLGDISIKDLEDFKNINSYGDYNNGKNPYKDKYFPNAGYDYQKNKLGSMRNLAQHLLEERLPEEPFNQLSGLIQPDMVNLEKSEKLLSESDNEGKLKYRPKENECRQIMADFYHDLPHTFCMDPHRKMACYKFCAKIMEEGRANRRKRDLAFQGRGKYPLDDETPCCDKIPTCKLIHQMLFKGSARRMCITFHYGNVCCDYCKTIMRRPTPSTEPPKRPCRDWIGQMGCQNIVQSIFRGCKENMCKSKFYTGLCGCYCEGDDKY